jgi:hypothetical protein
VQVYVSLLLLLEKYCTLVLFIVKSQLLSLVVENCVVNLLFVFGLAFYFQGILLGFISAFGPAYGPCISGMLL